MKKRLLRIWFCFIQFLTIPANFCYSRATNLQVVRPPSFTIENGTLIVANHQSKWDPFLISYHIGISNWFTIVPLRYPVTPDYMLTGWLRFFITIFGGYSIGHTPLQKLKGLALTRELLREQYSVVLFPEGKISYTTDETDVFQRGVEMLFSYNYPVVFVRLSKLNSPDKFYFWQKNRPTIEYSNFLGSDIPAETKIKKMMEFYNLTYHQK